MAALIERTKYGAMKHATALLYILTPLTVHSTTVFIVSVSLNV